MDEELSNELMASLK
jgi:hypothetical protein